MSETENSAFPPVNTFFADDCGITRWHAALDIVSVREVFGGVNLALSHFDSTIAYTLSVEHARHVAALLTKAADSQERRAAQK